MIKVLFVEDDPDQLFLYDEVFRMKDLLVIAAATKADALKMVRFDRPDIILLDIMLRHENGLDILELLKKDEDLKNVPVVVFTNTDKQEFRDRAQALGIVDFVIKSQVLPQEMVDRVKKYCGQVA